MEDLNKRDWYKELNRVKAMANYGHESYQVDLKMAKLYYTLTTFSIFNLPALIWRTRLLDKARDLHKECCDIED